MTPLIYQPIYPGTEYADHLGFTSDKFLGYLLDLNDGAIWISFIISKQPGKGHFSQFLERLLLIGKTVKVPTPFPGMEQILIHKEFTHTIEIFEFLQIDVWVKHVPHP